MKSLNEGIDYYYNAQGLMVLTAAFLRARGYCCGNGCLHCPYDYEAVAEPRRSQLRAQHPESGNDAEERAKEL